MHDLRFNLRSCKSHGISLRMHYTASLPIITLRCAADADIQGGGTALLPPSQPALLTMTVDGVMRIWVEVTVTPPPAALPAPLSPKEAPERAQQAPKAAEQVPSLYSFATVKGLVMLAGLQTCRHRVQQAHTNSHRLPW